MNAGAAGHPLHHHLHHPCLCLVDRGGGEAQIGDDLRQLFRAHFDRVILHLRKNDPVILEMKILTTSPLP